MKYFFGFIFFGFSLFSEAMTCEEQIPGSDPASSLSAGSTDSRDGKLAEGSNFFEHGLESLKPVDFENMFTSVTNEDGSLKKSG